MYIKINVLNIFTSISFIIGIATFTGSCSPREKPDKSMNDTSFSNSFTSGNNSGNNTSGDQETDTATLGTGCFWCTEAIFQQLKGVLKVTSGYSGGHIANPTYEQVCEKNTGHAEAVQVIFNPAEISFDELLEVFWQTHDPTTLNRQGNDEGPQYRSVIFYHNKQQKEKSEHYKSELDKSGSFKDPIVTAIDQYINFYAAENYHQNYYKNNGSQPYCNFVVRPKVEKFKKVFKDKLKTY